MVAHLELALQSGDLLLERLPDLEVFEISYPLEHCLAALLFQRVLAQHAVMLLELLEPLHVFAFPLHHVLQKHLELPLESAG